ncbi:MULTISPECIES: hypothetical protein [Stenotrophomonas]|uniref:hypothetical protein n=1 Tax=Stenotrophomonas TaxID=40323 RepID=UPI0007702EA9|nr:MULTISPECIES: hypothetical protein [Stenotrophomonas]AMJ57305.1 hypothetical protein AXG53_12150 [Stenotrophomonas sp. KCTC 12332]
MPTSPAKSVPLTVAALRQRLHWLPLLFGLLLVCAVALQAKAMAAMPLAIVSHDQVQASPEPGHPQPPLQMAAISEAGSETSRPNRQRPAPVLSAPVQLAPLTSQHVFMTAASDTLLQHAVERAQRYPLAPCLLLNPGHAPPHRCAA